MSDYIKSLLKSSAWEDIEASFMKEAEALKDPSDIPNNMRNDIYCREVRARVLASEMLTDFIKRIKLAGADIKPITKKTYI